MSIDELRTIALPYWARPGFMLATDPENGGGDDDEPDEDDSDDDEPDEDEGKSDEELREELKAVRRRLETSNKNGKKNRLRAKDLETQLGAARAPKPTPKEGEEEKVDAAAIREEALREARGESDTRVKRASLRAELRGAGIGVDQLARVAGMVNLDDLDVNDDGEVDGIDDAIASLKDDFPQLFGAVKRRRPGVTGPSDDKRDGGKRTLSASEMQARQLLGKR